MYDKNFTKYEPVAPMMFGKLKMKHTSVIGLLIFLTVSTVMFCIFIFKVVSEPIEQPYQYVLKSPEIKPEELVEPKKELLTTVIGVREIRAYTPSADETQGSPCVGAYGDNLCDMLDQGLHPVATNEFYRHKELLIGDTIYIVADTTPYDDWRIEIFMYTKDEAFAWGKKYLQVSTVQ